MRISDWSSDVCSSDLAFLGGRERRHGLVDHRLHIGRVDALSVLRDRDFGNGGGNGVGDERLGGFGGHITLKARQFALLKGGDALGEVSVFVAEGFVLDRKSTRLNSSH